MEHIPDIIKSTVISKEWDVYWEELPAAVSGETRADVLVLTTVFDAGSAEETQLQKILQACKLTAEQYHIIQLGAEQEIAWYKMREIVQPKTILLFGIMPQQLGISAMFRLFVPNQFNDCVWVASPSLTELEKQPEAKKQLWQVGLKPIFDNNPAPNS